ncbi:two-component system, chemotaxis family, response regulator CheY [Salinibacillus kushneri]|uniref:Two-component system, chemotaxis family, response regulator CheY n=1 Tax=Salinibacillus kushneri TaxID=237682 RepID=A0A1I0E0L7_9BACI|nr:response regulator [Salinibacillus kushneri]SET38560.1 two-component system, chemotaxis family, response regulator CheY [Salinibacillus kushneri]
MGKVLIVDDAQFMRLTLSNILTKGGHEVVGEAADGQEAIELYKNLQPDLVTMDITMPNLDGMDAAEAIIEKNPGAKIIMCSAVGQQRVVVQAIQLGARDFIVKPFDESRVLDTIDRVLNG